MFRMILFLFSLIVLAACHSEENTMTSVTQVRNATLQINYAGKKLLVDPMLSKKGSFPGFPGTANSHLRNPLVDLPFSAEKVVDVDAIIITHLHADHWDDEAQKLIAKDKPLFVQNEEDAKELRTQGYTKVTVLTKETQWEGLTLRKTDGRHGTEETLKKVPILGTVSGVIMSHPGQKSIYIAGDTIWNNEVKETLDAHKPDVIILNAGAATVVGLPPIIMDEKDVISVARHAPKAKIIATHMEAINHCVLSRKELKDALEKEKLNSHVAIPKDGETLTL